MDDAARLAFTRLRRDLRGKARAAGIDPDAAIAADELERDARGRGERPRTARRVADEAWRERVEAFRDGPVID